MKVYSPKYCKCNFIKKDLKKKNLQYNYNRGTKAEQICNVRQNISKRKVSPSDSILIVVLQITQKLCESV